MPQSEVGGQGLLMTNINRIFLKVSGFSGWEDGFFCRIETAALPEKLFDRKLLNPKP